MWIGLQRDLILNRRSRLRGSGFRGAGPPRSWHTLPLFHVPSASLGALEAPRSASLGRTRAASGAASASRTSPNLSLPEFNSLPSIRGPSCQPRRLEQRGTCMEVGVLSVPCPLRAADSCGRDCGPESGPTRTRRTVHAGAGHRKRGPGPFLSLLCLRNINFFAALANPETVWKGYPILYLVGPGRRTSPGRPTTLPGTPAVCTPPRLVPNVVILLQAISKGAKRPHFPARSSRKLRRRALSISRGAKRAGVGGQEK